MKMNTNAADNISIAKKLFHSAMKGEWSNVVEIYQQDSAAHKAKITRSGDTVLHIAVSDIQEDIVEELVSIVKQNNSKEALEIRNERGDTALHIAASLGSVRICSCIAEVDQSLIGTRNHDNETPLFVAALHGKRDAFLCLNSYLKNNPERGYSYSRRKDGQTILHCAISGDYFDLAFQIIHLYGMLVNSVDEHGLSPLHILASKTTAFRSGSHLGRGNGIIYHCIFVDDLKVDLSFHQPANISKEMQSKNYPDNYATCIHFLMLLKKLVQPVFGSSSPQKDAENPESTNSKPQGSPRPKKEAENRQARNKTAQRHQLLPPNYHTCFHFVKLVSKAMLIVLGLGSRRIKKLAEKKKKHRWSVQIMNELVQRASCYEYEDNGSSPQPPSDDHETKPYTVSGGDVTFVTEAFHENDHPAQLMLSPDNDKNQEQNGKKALESKSREENAKKECVSVMKRETPILIAANCGITEMVEKILEVCPVAIHDTNSEKKNIVLLAVESRQPHVYQLLLQLNIMKDSIFRAVDANGNSALHLAAMLADHKPWLIPGAALQMQWEIKWYEFVKNSMPYHFFVRYNKQGKTPRDIFSDNHDDLVKKGGEWLTNTSESCSVVAALIATVAFATSTAVPGGVNEDSGKPILEFHPAFDVFAISSLIALCFSVTAVVMFLSILTSRYQERDFGTDLPRKLLCGLTSLFVSIASIIVSFCAGHFFVLKDKLKYAAYPVYAVTCLPVTLFAVAQFPLYVDLAWATFKKVPQRSYRAVLL